jgi:Domain of unknown function (DUF4180)
MADAIETLHGIRALFCDPNGQTVRSDRDAVDLIGTALSERCKLVVLPVERLGDDFFQLKTRILGDVIQKFVNYERRLAILGNIDRHLEASKALSDFVYETNRGRQVWFVANKAELESRLQSG